MHSQGIHHQRGVSTLVVAVVLLIAATFLTFFAAKIGIQEQRMAGNDARQKESLAVAEGLLARAKTFLDVNAAFVDQSPPSTPWWTCATADAAHKPPLLCGDGTTPAVFGDGWEYLIVRDLSPVGGATGAQALDGIPPLDPLNGHAYFVRRTGSSALVDPLVVVAQGHSADNSGESVVRQVLRRTYTLSPGPLPPLTAPATGLLGSFNVVGNPNHALTLDELMQITPQTCDNYNSGSGQMLSLWTKDDFNSLTTGNANWATCQAQFFKENTDPLLTGNSGCFLGTKSTGCGCQRTQDPLLSFCGGTDFEKSPDPNKFAACGIVDNDSQFPQNVFEWMFGASPSDVKAKADQVLTNCDSLDQNSSGLIWVDGACSPSAEQVGSRADPVILVVKGDITFNSAKQQIWGVVVSHNPSGVATSVKLTGGFTVHGAMVIDNAKTDLSTGGTYNIIYDPCVFAAVFNNDSFVEYAPVEGGWSDQL